METPDEARSARVGVELLDRVRRELVLRIVEVGIPRAEAAARVAARRERVHEVERVTAAHARGDEVLGDFEHRTQWAHHRGISSNRVARRIT